MRAPSEITQIIKHYRLKHKGARKNNNSNFSTARKRVQGLSYYDFKNKRSSFPLKINATLSKDISKNSFFQKQYQRKVSPHIQLTSHQPPPHLHFHIKFNKLKQEKEEKQVDITFINNTRCINVK